jgi:hypothetical protein
MSPGRTKYDFYQHSPSYLLHRLDNIIRAFSIQTLLHHIIPALTLLGTYNVECDVCNECISTKPKGETSHRYKARVDPDAPRSLPTARLSASAHFGHDTGMDEQTTCLSRSSA